MILKCNSVNRCHQTKSFGHSPSRQIWRPCSAHAPCPPPPRSPKLQPAWPPLPFASRAAVQLLARCEAGTAGGRRARAGEGRPGPATAPFPAQTPLVGPGGAGPRPVPLMRLWGAAAAATRSLHSAGSRAPEPEPAALWMGGANSPALRVGTAPPGRQGFKLHPPTPTWEMGLNSSHPFPTPRHTPGSRAIENGNIGFFFGPKIFGWVHLVT